MVFLLFSVIENFTELGFSVGFMRVLRCIGVSLAPNLFKLHLPIPNFVDESRDSSLSN